MGFWFRCVSYHWPYYVHRPVHKLYLYLWTIVSLKNVEACEIFQTSTYNVFQVEPIDRDCIIHLPEVRERNMDTSHWNISVNLIRESDAVLYKNTCLHSHPDGYLTHVIINQSIDLKSRWGLTSIRKFIAAYHQPRP